MGWVNRSAQIHRSWAMLPQWESDTNRTLHVYSLVFITRGEGSFWDALTKTERPVCQGDLLCLFPGIAHVYVPCAGTTWDEINIEFSGPVFDAWSGLGMLDAHEPVRHLARPKDTKEIESWLERFHQVVLPMAHREHSEPTLDDVGRMLNLIAQMCGTWQKDVAESEVEWANEARQKLMQWPLEKKLDLKSLAVSFGLGEQAYRKKFKRLCGVSPSVFHARRQIEEACYLLISTNTSIKEIGYNIGFGSLFYFSRRFKQVTGVSPQEYRNQARA